MTQSNTGGSPIETETLRRLVAEATRGPWFAQSQPWPEQIGCCPLTGRPFSIHHGMKNVAAATTFENAVLIALAPSLAAEVLALRAREAEMRAALTQINVGDGWAAQIARTALSQPDSGEGDHG